MNSLKNNTFKENNLKNLKENSLNKQICTREIIKDNLTALDISIENVTKNSYANMDISDKIYSKYEDLYVELCDTHKDIYLKKHTLFKKAENEYSKIYLNLIEELAKLLYNSKLVFNLLTFLEHNSFEEFKKLDYIEELPIENISSKSKEIVSLDLDNILQKLYFFRLKVEDCLEKIQLILEDNQRNKKDTFRYKIINLFKLCY